MHTEYRSNFIEYDWSRLTNARLSTPSKDPSGSTHSASERRRRQQAPRSTDNTANHLHSRLKADGIATICPPWLKLYEDGVRAKTRSTSAKKSDKSVDLDDTESEVEAASPTPLHPYPERTGRLRHMQKAADLHDHGPIPKPEDSGSVKSVSSTLPDESTAYAVKASSDSPERGRGRVTQNKGKSFVKKANIAEDEALAYPEEEGHDDDDNQDASCPALGDEDGYGYDAYSYPAAQRKEDEDESYEDFELEEDEALALNALEELDPESSESGHAIQLQWAANAAFGKAKGKRGKKPKGKAKGKAQGKARAHIAIAQPRHDDDGGGCANFVHKTCRDCGHVSQENGSTCTLGALRCALTPPRTIEEVLGVPPEPMCGTFVDEVPQEFQKERKAVAELSLEATEQAFPTVQAVMADDANADFNPEAAEALLGLFQGRVTQRPLFMTGCARSFFCWMPCRLLGDDARCRIPPAIGLTPVNDIVQCACSLLDAPEREAFRRYYSQLASSRRRALDTHMPEPAPVLTDVLTTAEALARYYLMEGQVVTGCYTCCHWVRSLVMASAVWRADMGVTQGTVTQLIATDCGVSSVHAGRQMIIAGSMPQAGAALPSALAFGAPSSDFAVDGPDEAMAGESPAAQGPAGDLPGHASSSTAGAGRVGSGNLANPASSSVQGNLAVFLSDSDEIMLPAVDNAGPVAAVQPADTTAADVDLSEMD
ncbi:unnamed protein product [Symbiodinium sp. KB8]|nr:unnamed protein product [Symbiodinium sp. KB8]